MSVAAYGAWLTGTALPFWLANGIDRDDSGLFWERLHLDGTPDREAELRIRTQFRQVYVFAQAAILGLAPEAATVAPARRALARLRAAAWAPDGRPGWVHRIRRDGSVVDGRRDLYDHAFALHGLAWMARATGEAVYRAWIDETLAFVDTALRSDWGGWAESDRRELPRRQNPHMHLFEAALALFETSGDAAHLALAGEIFGLFRTRFFDHERGVLREHFDERWQPDEALGWGRLEPGHMSEWVWLLRRFARLGRRPVDGYCTALLDAVVRLGRDAGSGFLVDEVDAGGTPLLATRRLWAQTEYLKALIVEAEAQGDPRLGAEADALCARLQRTYLAATVDGCWRDRFTLDGRLAVDHVPASTLYHLLTPLGEIARLAA